MKLTEKIVRVGVARIDLRHVFERVNGGITVAQRPVREPEVVPGARILWLLSRRLEECVAGLREALRLNQRDTFVQPRGNQRWIAPERLPE